MPLLITRENIAEIKCDAIVNSTNNALQAEGYGVDFAISKVAGQELQKARALLGGCETGKAKYTQGYGLPCKYLIHTVGPKWRGGDFGEAEFLASAYTESLRLAQSLGCETVAVPLISAGAHGYPKKEAYELASKAIQAFLQENELTVYLALFEEESFVVEERDRELSQRLRRQDDFRFERYSMCESASFEDDFESSKNLKADCVYSIPLPKKSKGKSLEERLKELDESFSQALLRMIDERGMKDSECYKLANVDRRLFSKIRSNPHYHPTKATAVAFAVALKLSLEEAHAFVGKAGYSLTGNNKFDIIVEYYLEKGNYNIYEINETLFAHDQSLLGEF